MQEELQTKINDPVADLGSDFISDDDVDTSSGGAKPWRAAAGVLCRGKAAEYEVDPKTMQVAVKSAAVDYETRPFLNGKIVRIGEKHDINDQGQLTGRRLFVDLLTGSGPETFHVTFWSSQDMSRPWKSYSQFNGLAGGLALTSGNEQIVITAAKGEGKNPSGEAIDITYVNLKKALPKGAPQVEYRPVKIDRDEANPGASFEARLLALHKHPNWAGLVAKEKQAGSGAPTHYAEFCKEIEAKGWPSPVDCPAWVDVFSKVTGQPLENLTSIPEDQWGAIRLKFQTISKMPKAVEAWVAAQPKGAAPAAAVADDPYADI